MQDRLQRHNKPEERSLVIRHRALHDLTETFASAVIVPPTSPMEVPTNLQQ